MSTSPAPLTGDQIAKRITHTSLVSLPAPAPTDTILVHEISTGENKKITIAELAAQVGVTGIGDHQVLRGDTDGTPQGSPVAIDDTGNVTGINDLTIAGTLTFLSTPQQIDATNVVVQDPLIKGGADNPNNVLDLGQYFEYDASGTSKYTGFFRDASDGFWKLFDFLQAEPTTTVNTGGTGYTNAALAVEHYTCPAGYDLRIQAASSQKIKIESDISVVMELEESGITAKKPIRLDDGASESAPALAFDGDTNTGLYRVTNDQLGVSIGGTQRLRFEAGKVVLSDGYDIECGTTSGTRIGTSSSQKIGFYNTSPVVRQTVTGARDDPESALKNLLTTLVVLGLVIDSTTAS